MSCRQSEKADACFDDVEARLLEASRGRAERSGQRLRLLASHGISVALADDTTAEEGYVRYRYRGYLYDIVHHLIEVRGYEAHGFLVVDGLTGRLTHLQAVPVISPDRSRFVTASLDLEAGYSRNAIQVWRLTEAGLQLEFDLDGGRIWGPSDSVWRDARTIEFRKNVVTSDPGRHAQSPAWLVLGPAGWTVREFPPAP